MMKITWEGPVGVSTGYGVASRNYARELMKLCDVRVVSTIGRYDNREMYESSKKSKEGRIHVLHDFPLRPADVYYTVFEMDRAPENWGRMLSKAKMVFTPSEHSKAALGSVMHGSKIQVVHHGVDFEEFNTEVPGADLFPSVGCKQSSEWLAKSYKFLYVAEWIERKRVQDLVQAFCYEFKPEEPTSLMLRVRSNHVAVKRLVRENMKTGKENVFVIGGKYESLAPIYRACDCYVSTSACEGWGETLTEAMACGLPVISGRKGGQMEFLRDDNAFLVPPVDEQGVPIGHNSLEPTVEPWFRYWPLDLDILSKQMRRAYEHEEVAQKKAEQALEDIKQFTWEAAAKKMLGYLETL